MYDYLHTPKIYHSLCSILQRLQKQTSFIVINGADIFVQQALKSKTKRFTGVNQETGFTAIDFEHDIFSAQK